MFVCWVVVDGVGDADLVEIGVLTGVADGAVDAGEEAAAAGGVAGERADRVWTGFIPGLGVGGGGGEEQGREGCEKWCSDLA